MGKKRETAPPQVTATEQPDEMASESSPPVNPGQQPQPDYDHSLDFLRWHTPEGPWVLTAIVPDKGKTTTTATFRPAQEDELRAWLDRHGETHNLYYSVNPTIGDMNKKAERSDIARLAWLHVDVDPRAGEDIAQERKRALGVLRGYDPPPSAIIDSGGGYQGLWRLSDGMDINGEEAAFEEAKLYNLDIELKLDADNCRNVDRVFRLPGTVNWPNAKKRKQGRQPSLAQVVEQHDDRVYPLAKFAKAPNPDRHRKVDASLAARAVSVQSVDDLPSGVSDLCKLAIVHGKDIPADTGHSTDWPSRSEAVFHVCCELVRAEVTDELIYGIITDPNYKISESVREKGTASDKYARRQIERAHDRATDADLAKLNEKYAVVSDVGGGKCRVVYREPDHNLKRDWIVRQSFADFRNALMNRRKVVGQNKDGVDLKKPLGGWWLEHEKRRQFDKIVFAPGQEIPGAYNLWKGFAYNDRKGDCSLYLDFVREVICSGDDSIYDYIIHWMARGVQQPDKVGEIALVLRGGRGTGKGTFAQHYGKLFGQHFIHLSNADHLSGKFNAHLHDASVVFADEAFYSGDRKHEKTMNMLVTESVIPMEGKGLDVVTVPNLLHFIIASNDEWVVPAGPDERRYCVLDIPTTRQQDNPYFEAIREQMSNGGREALLYHLLHEVDLSGFDVRKYPRTGALRDQQVHSLPPVERVVLDFLENGEWPVGERQGDGSVFVPTLPLREWIGDRTRREISQHAVGRFLGCDRLGFAKAGGGGRPRGYIVPPLPEARERWDQVMMRRDWDDEEDWAVGGLGYDDRARL